MSANRTHIYVFPGKRAIRRLPFPKNILLCIFNVFLHLVLRRMLPEERQKVNRIKTLIKLKLHPLYKLIERKMEQQQQE